MRGVPGSLRTEAVAFSGVTLQIVRNWVLKLNARGLAGDRATELGSGHVSRHLVLLGGAAILDEAVQTGVLTSSSGLSAKACVLVTVLHRRGLYAF